MRTMPVGRPWRRLTPLLLVVAVVGGSRGRAVPVSSAPPSAGQSRVGVTPHFVDMTATNLPQVALQGRSMEARAGDVDNDGDLDILVAKEWAANVLLLNDGQGRFMDASVTHLPQTIHDSEDVALADVDDDGDLDAIIASEDDQVSEYYLNDGTGVFRDVSPRLPTPGHSNAVVAGDIDGDGDLDIILGNHGQDRVFINDGAGMFADETTLRLPLRTDVTQDVALGDIENDGDLDLLLGNEDGNALLINTGAGVFTAAAPGQLPLGTQPEETRNADFGDIDTDGDLDIFFANVAWVVNADPQDRVLRNDGAGNFSDITSSHLPRESAFTLDGDFADLDRDGDVDLVTAAIPVRPFRVLQNTGAGAFADATTAFFPPTATGEAIEVEVADYNRDGWPDIYIATYRGPDRVFLADPTRQIYLPVVVVDER